MIHEIVHQWRSLGSMFDFDGGGSPWSSEGISAYTTCRVAKELFSRAKVLQKSCRRCKIEKKQKSEAAA